MRIAYLITAYIDPPQLARLINALDEDADFFVHVDRKVDILPFQRIIQNPRVLWASHRHCISWGGYSQVKSILTLMEDMLSTGTIYDKVFCLSGMDYPVYTNQELRQLVHDTEGKQLLTGGDITNVQYQRYRNKVYLYWLLDIPFCNKVLRRVAGKLLSYIRDILHRFAPQRRGFVVSNGQRYDIYFGSDYWAMTYDCVKYVHHIMTTQKALTRYLKTCFAPSELFVHTVVYNSPFRDTTLAPLKAEPFNLADLTPLHYLIYDSHIHILTEKNIVEILASKKPFFRKAASGISDELIALLHRQK